MPRPHPDPRYRAAHDDDPNEQDGVPEDGRQAWFSLLLIGLSAAAAAALLYGIIRVIE